MIVKLKKNTFSAKADIQGEGRIVVQTELVVIESLHWPNIGPVVAGSRNRAN